MGVGKPVQGSFNALAVGRDKAFFKPEKSFFGAALYLIYQAQQPFNLAFAPYPAFFVVEGDGIGKDEDANFMYFAAVYCQIAHQKVEWTGFLLADQCGSAFYLVEFCFIAGFVMQKAWLAHQKAGLLSDEPIGGNYLGSGQPADADFRVTAVVIVKNVMCVVPKPAHNFIIGTASAGNHCFLFNVRADLQFEKHRFFALVDRQQHPFVAGDVESRCIVFFNINGAAVFPGASGYPHAADQP